MYKVPIRQITGDPDWLDSSLWDIEAKTDHPCSIDDLYTMFQNLLADRFHLKFHIEQRQGSVYLLTLDKGGSDKSGLKMRPNDSPQDYKIPVTPHGPGAFTGVRVPMNYLSWFLGQQLQLDKRPVLDRTGLTGNYDFTLSFAPETLSDYMPTLRDAILDQLGLGLDPARGPVDYYVIDHIDKPTEN